MNDDTTLVLGATGKTGRRVAARLRLRGMPVRAASRSSATRFDWSDPAGWDPALRGVTAAYIVAPAGARPGARVRARAEAAGVQRLVLLSGHGADTWGDSDVRAGHALGRGRRARLGAGVDRAAASNFVQNFDEDLFHAPLVAGELALPSARPPSRSSTSRTSPTPRPRC